MHHGPPDYGHWKNVHRRFCRWRDKGVWEDLLDLFRNYTKREKRSRIRDLRMENMKYEIVKGVGEEEFRRLSGVKKATFSRDIRKSQ